MGFRDGFKQGQALMDQMVSSLHIKHKERTKRFLPKCPFCHQQDFRMVRPATLVNSRVKTARVRMGVQCSNCGMRMTASRHPSSSKWTFWESD